MLQHFPSVHPLATAAVRPTDAALPTGAVLTPGPGPSVVLARHAEIPVGVPVDRPVGPPVRPPLGPSVCSCTGPSAGPDLGPPDALDPYDWDGPRPPGVDAPPTCEVPWFPPVRVHGGRWRPGPLTRHRRRAVAAGLAVTAAVLVAAGPRAVERARGRPASSAPVSPSFTHRSASSPSSGSVSASGPSSPSVRTGDEAEKVTAAVRIADAATVRLLRPGDRVDVIASDGRGQGRVVAGGARVSAVPDSEVTGTGALVVLSVPRSTAARLAGAGITSQLAVTLC
ncbi:hypothetical protein [Streptomyces sp. NPDC006875]|uniref:hypothetical protein n=1 Tax=Streptomyces sp. NPDC006875 TaxID=3154781 RepID=UPI0033FD59EA